MSATVATHVPVPVQFNASVAVTELLTKTLENVAKDLATRCISECALKYGFDATEAINCLGLQNLALIRKQMTKKSTPKTPKEKQIKQKITEFPLPFIAELVNPTGCQGLAYNKGLFTQCSKKCMENGSYCKGCQTDADKSANGCPSCGTVASRLASNLYEFTDSKGRHPIIYANVLNKLKISQEVAIYEAGKLNVEIANEHFVIPEKPKKDSARGRPKKATVAVEANDIEDLFAKLTSEEPEQETILVEEPKKKSKLTDEEKAAKKAALELEREAKKLERETKLAEEKAAKEIIRKAEIEAKKLERETKLAEEKAAREAKRLQEKAEREAKKEQEKAEKEAAKKNKKNEAPVTVKAPVVEATVAKTETKPKETTTTTKETVTRIKIGDKVYLKTKENVLYDPMTKEPVGIYDPATQTIASLPDDEDDEDEDDEEEEEEEESYSE